MRPYDDWWLRRGRYALDEETGLGWFADVAELEFQLEEFAPRGDVLELAAGTGTWTRHLVGYADRVTAVDAVPVVLELNRAKTAGAAEYVCADIFAWEPPRAFDSCVFGLWPRSPAGASQDSGHSSTVRSSLAGRVFLVDNARPRDRVSASGEVERRMVADGREFDIVTRYWKPAQLEAEVARLGWELIAGATTNGHFIFASARRSNSL